MTPRHPIPAALTLAIVAAVLASPLVATKTTYYGLTASYGALTTDATYGTHGVTSDVVAGLHAQDSWKNAFFDYVDGVDNVSEQTNVGNYIFNLSASSSVTTTRTLCFDFGSQATPAAFANGPCLVVGGATVAVIGDNPPALTALAQGQTTVRRYHIGWDGVESGVKYTYHFAYGRDWNGDGVPDSNPAIVMCTNNPGSGCVAWEVQPDQSTLLQYNGTTPTVPYQVTLSRQQYLSAGRLGTEQLVGVYSMPFTLNLALK